MDLRDIKTLKGIISELQGYLEGHIRVDDEFFSKLKELAFLRKDATELEQKFDRIHKTIKSDLEKAAAMAAESEKRIQQGKLSAREINLIFPYILSYDQLLYQSKKGLTIQFGLKSEIDLLADFLHETEKKGFDKSVLDLIKERMLAGNYMHSKNSFRELMNLKEKLSEKVKAHFKVKRRMINFNRPKISEVVSIGTAQVYIEIFFDSHLNDSEIKKQLEGYTNILSANMETTMNVASCPLEIVKHRVAQKQRIMQYKSLEEIENMWLSQLKDVVVDLLRSNKDLIITPTFKYQLRIGKDEGGIAYCNRNSTADNYLFGLDISTLIISYLIADNFYESFPDSFFSELIGALTYWMQKAERLPDISYSAIQRSLSIISRISQEYRMSSIYSILGHETEHAVDRKYLDKLNKLRPLLEYLIRKSGFYKDHKNLNLRNSLVELMNFYLTCRVEAPTQFREFIVSIEKQDKESAYHLISPINIPGGRKLIKELNKIIIEIDEISKKDDLIIGGNQRLKGLAYKFSHLMNIIIFLADCKKQNIDLVMLDSASLEKLEYKFPTALPMLLGYSGARAVIQGSPEWFLLQSIRQGTGEQFIEILKKSKIHRLNLDDIPYLMHNNTQFYIFRPQMNIMRSTLEKIEKTDEVSYFELYLKSCGILKIKLNEAVISMYCVKELADTLAEANDRLIKRAGFHA